MFHYEQTSTLFSRSQVPLGNAYRQALLDVYESKNTSEKYGKQSFQLYIPNGTLGTRKQKLWRKPQQ